MTFFDGTRTLATVKKGVEGCSRRTGHDDGRMGQAQLRATARDAAGRTYSATRTVRVCT